MDELDVALRAHLDHVREVEAQQEALRAKEAAAPEVNSINAVEQFQRTMMSETEDGDIVTHYNRASLESFSIDPEQFYSPSVPEYRIKRSRSKAWQSVMQTNGLTTVIRLESGELCTVKGRAEIIGVYDPSIPLEQFRSDIT